MTRNLTFNEWMRAVDAFIADKVGGLTSEDLPDCSYTDWWEDGKNPRSAAAEAIRRAKE